MSEFYSVYYYSSPALGSVYAAECQGVDFETACNWFKHHTTNVCANIGMTARVIMTDSDDYIILEWKHGQGITWPEHACEANEPM